MDRKHMDWENMQQAIERTETVVRDVNEAKRLAEHLNQVIEIQNSFVWGDPEPELVTPTRRFLREGPVKKLTKSLTSNTSDRHFFLFNDLLLIGASALGKNLVTGKKYAFKGMHPIESIIVWDVKDGDGGKHVKNAFTIVRTDKKDKSTYLAPTKVNIYIRAAHTRTLVCIFSFPTYSFLTHMFTPLCALQERQTPTWRPHNITYIHTHTLTHTHIVHTLNHAHAHFAHPRSSHFVNICFSVRAQEDKDSWINTVNECIINIPNLSKDRRDTKAIREAAFLAFKKTLVASP